MSAFIVSGGALLEIGCPSTLSRETEQQVAFTRTLGGKRKAFLRRGGRRSWSIDVAVARPGEVATLDTLARHGESIGWYGPEAVIGNLLAPQEVDWDPVPMRATDTGLVQLPDGTIARSVTAHSGDVVVGSVPIRPGVAITASVWCRGGVTISMEWLSVDGSSVGSSVAGPQSAETWARREASFDPPNHVARARLTLSGGIQYARPAIAWGETVRDEQGMGCQSALIHNAAFTPVALWEGANFTQSAYTVTELG